MKYQNLIAKMTLEEKVSLLSGKNFWQTVAIPKYQVPSIFLSDGPHGMRKQAVAADHLGLNESLKATCFPTAVSIANSWNEQLGEELGKRLGQEAVAQHVNVVLGPGVNIKRNPRCGRNFEYFSEDPMLAGKMAASYIRGIQSNGISACVKHFAANNQEHRRLVSNSVIDERTLREIYLTPFEIAVKEGKTKSIMSSYNLVNGTYANENIHLLRDILRKEWGFNGTIISDWGGNNDRVKALVAGADLEMPTTNGETNQEVIQAIKNGSLSIDYLDEAVERILTLIFETSIEYKTEKVPFDVDEHHEFAMKAEEESIVLLKNENHVLPLQEKTKVAVIGDFAKKPRFQGAGSSIVNPTRIDSPLDCIQKSHLDFVGFAPGFHRFGKQSKGLIKKACSLAKTADVILLYIGLDEITELEGKDRDHLDLPVNQLQLIDALSKLGKKIVAVLSCGSVIEMKFIGQVDALVHGFLGGQAGSNAVVKVITGKTNPSGKLAETYAFKYSDYSTSLNYPGKELTAEYREGPFIGYRYFDSLGMKVLFPFGFGLSYTTFQYSNLKIDPSKISFKIKNTGPLTGKEISQLYIGKKDSPLIRPKKELKGFSKIELKPGESRTVSIPLNEFSFRYFNTETNRYEIEPGKYEIYIGSSSAQIELSGFIEVEGTTKLIPHKNKDLKHYYNVDIQQVPDEEFERLLGYPIPNSKIEFYKKNRLIAHSNTTIEELKYAKGWFGRLFSGSIRFGIWFLKAIGKKETATVLAMGMLQQPLRGVSRMSGGIISWNQLEGIMQMINGQFFKGFRHFMKASKERHITKKTKV